MLTTTEATPCTIYHVCSIKFIDMVIHICWPYSECIIRRGCCAVGFDSRMTVFSLAKANVFPLLPPNDLLRHSPIFPKHSRPNIWGPEPSSAAVLVSSAILALFYQLFFSAIFRTKCPIRTVHRAEQLTLAEHSFVQCKTENNVRIQ